MENVFHDKKLSLEEIKNILRDGFHKKFISFAALLLGRTTDIKGVFSTYLDKITFCRNWRKIKQKMRKDKWRSPNINFWDQVYNVLVEKKEIKEAQETRIVQERKILKKPELGNLSDIIKKTRKEQGWTQKELAEHVELSQQTISLMESGKFNFSVKSLMKILSALQLKLELSPRDVYKNSVDSVRSELTPLKTLRPRVQYFSRVDSSQTGALPLEYVDDKPQPENEG